MKILAISHDVGSPTVEQFQQHGRAEAARAWELVQQGVFREMYFDRDKGDAVLMLECESVEAARAVLDTLPMVQAGLIAFDLMPLVAYSGFARLFADPHP